MRRVWMSQILLVGDDNYLRGVAAKLLEQAGHQAGPETMDWNDRV